MAGLSRLCDELFHLILLGVDPSDLARLSATCRSFHAFISRNTLLWKSFFLHSYDDPRRPSPGSDDANFDWEAKLKALTRLEKILAAPTRDVKKANMRFVCTNAVWLARNASRSASKNVEFLSLYFRSPKDRWDHSDEPWYARRTGINLISDAMPRLKEYLNVDVFMRNSLLFHIARGTSLSQDPELQDLSAQLACMYGAEPDLRRARNEDLSDASGPRMRSHCFARSEVYDLRFYTKDNRWGPWRMENGSLTVDWHRVQCLLVVLAYNFRLVDGLRDASAGRFWTAPFEGVQPDSYDYNERPDRAMYLTDSTPPQEQSLPLLQQPSPPPELFDPYGVTGSWERIICFLDYPDFVRHNFPRYPRYLSGRRAPINIGEAVRGFVVALEVVQVVPPGPNDGKELPLVHFRGTTKASQDADPNASSRLTGTVRLTPHGDVRWSSLSIFDGEPRWRSEGVQIGGVRSQRGVIGTWFAMDYDDAGPCGPSALWKISDQVSRSYAIS